jgi:hypothetical protein
MRARTAAILLSLGLGLVATASPAREHEHDDQGEREGRHKDAGAQADDSDLDDDDGGAPAVDVKRSAAQAQFRDQRVAKEQREMTEFARRVHRKLTMQERQAMGVHWRHVMRLIRIRELAEEDKDSASMAKVDALLEREGAKFSAKLESEGGDGGAK